MNWSIFGNTVAGVNSLKQWTVWHSLFLHGNRQSNSRDKTKLFSHHGAHNRSLEGPNKATTGVPTAAAICIGARADLDWRVPDARREFLRVKCIEQGGLDLYPTQDSAVLTSTAWADGLVDNPAQQAIRKGETVRFLPYSELYR